MKEIQKNVCLTEGQVESLELRRDKSTGRVVPAFQHQFPNRRERRFDPNRTSGGNRKQNAARAYQRVEVMIPLKTKRGTIMEPSGLVRRIVHKFAQSKTLRNLSLPVWGLKP